MSARSIYPAALVGACLLLVCACSGGKSGPSESGSASPSPTTSSEAGLATDSLSSSPAAAGIGVNDPAAGALTGTRLRIVNLFDPKGVPGPALDVYDVALQGQKATPILSNVAYGSVSPYFVPHGQNGVGGHPVITLTAMPAGEDPVAGKADAQGLGGMYDDGSHAQATFVLTADTGDNIGGKLAGLSFSSRIEKGDDGQGGQSPVAPAAPSGQGEILVDTSPSNGLNKGSLGLYLLIGNSCAPPINGDPASKGAPYIFAVAASPIKSSFAIFTTTPGAHQVSVVAWTSSYPPTCAQLTAKQGTTTIDVAAGQQVEAYVYGTSVKNVHLAVAPLQQ